MKIEKYKRQHTEILNGISELRHLVHAGITGNADRIAKEMIALSSLVRMHLAVEDKYLYPAIEAGADVNLRRMSRRYAAEMDGIAQRYLAFASSWNTAVQIERAPEGFRAGANAILRQVYERMQRENTEFYPAIEASAPVAV